MKGRPPKRAQKKRPSAPQDPEFVYEERMRTRHGLVAEAHIESWSLRKMEEALVPLDFSQRRRLLRWACDFYSIDAAKLGGDL